MDYQHVLVYFMWTFTAVSAQDVKYFLKGHDIHLMPSISERPIESIWLHNENDVVFFTGTEDFVNSSYKNRITLDRVSAELTIKNATYEDSGVYHLGMDINNELHTFQCTIEVIDKVSKPNISCEMSDTKQATLVCSTESKHPHLLKFKWSSPGKEQTGPNLKITVRNEDDDQVYRCDVSNPLTNETASFTAKDCFLGKRSDGQLIFICIFTLVIVVCCVLYITHQYLKACFDTYIMNRRPSAVKVSRERDENTCFLDKVFTLPFNQNKINKKGNSGLNVLTEDEEMHSEGAMPLTAPVHALHSSSTDINTITELSDTSNDQQVHLRNSEENVKTDDFLSGATLSDWGGIRRRSKSWTGTISTNDRTVHLKKEDNFRERIMTSSLK
ncbi:SLAM family member 9-like isoform X1 [Entelurus aequoreus]|uniref:SLAM family member 9-like isoform X1 n=1 Tax=Entelurus aequoreus TaxID=161455 RepID=UPI002B1CF223|nr:SLAM family member 9-like isoform X1 [Entelurus aequoreus]